MTRRPIFSFTDPADDTLEVIADDWTLPAIAVSIPDGASSVLLGGAAVDGLIASLCAWREGAGGGWADHSEHTAQIHRRAVGDFVLMVDDTPDGWAWSVTWGDNTIAEGETVNTRADNDQPDAWASSLPRAKAECEDAARKDGLAVGPTP